MNAKEQYKQAYAKSKTSAMWRWSDTGDTPYERAAIKSRLMLKAQNPMTFKQFIDCLEAAQTGNAYATRNHWFFIVDGDELQFTKEECLRYARYFSEGFHMNFAQYTTILKAGGLYINERLFEDDEVFPMRVKLYAYNRFILGQVHCATKTGWVCHHNETISDIRYYASRDELAQAEYATQQADLAAEISMQRYGI